MPLTGSVCESWNPAMADDPVRDAQDALVGLARELVDELAGARLLEIALARKPEPADSAHDVGATISGRKVVAVLSHPQSQTLIYDLGGGHFDEEMGGKVGGVLHSDQFRHDHMLAKGWRVRVSAGKPAAS